MSIDIGRRVTKHDYGDQFAPYTCVVVKNTDSEDSFTSGNSSGRTLTVENLWASQTMADNLMAQVKGARHQPFTATGAILDPAAELGDSITVDGVTGIMYRRNQRFGTLYRTDISSPGDEEINHEIPYYPPVRRYLNRVGGIARGAAAAAATALERELKLTADQTELLARVDGAEAGLRASVKMDLYQDASGKTYHIAYTYVDENGRTVYVDENGIEHYDLTFVGGYASASVMAEIGSVKAGLDSKASTQTVTELSGRVSTIETAENTLTARVGEVESTLLQKAEKTTVTDLQGRVATNESAISSLVTRAGNAESALEQKADSTTVTTLSGRVTTVETAQSNLTARVGEAETSLAQKASSQSVTDLSGRVSTIESAETTLSSRVGDAEASLQLKADSSTVSGLSSSVATLSADIAKIQADIIDLNGSVNVNGNLYVSGGNVTSKETISSLKSIVASQNISANGNLSAGGTLRVGGENNYLNFSNGVLSAPTGKFNYLQIGLDTYSPTNITSTSGAVYTVLGAA